MTTAPSGIRPLLEEPLVGSCWPTAQPLRGPDRLPKGGAAALRCRHCRSLKASYPSSEVEVGGGCSAPLARLAAWRPLGGPPAVAAGYPRVRGNLMVSCWAMVHVGAMFHVCSYSKDFARGHFPCKCIHHRPCKVQDPCKCIHHRSCRGDGPCKRKHHRPCAGP